MTPFRDSSEVSVHALPRWSSRGFAADFERVQILVTVYGGDPDKWLESIRTHGTEAHLEDEPFVLELKQRLAEDPELIETLRRIVRAFAETFGTADDRGVRKDAIVIESANPSILSAVKDFAQTIEQQFQADTTIIDTLASLPTEPRAEHFEQLRRNADLRRRFLKEVPLLRSADVAKLSGSVARNVSAKANRWKTERRIFSISEGGVDRYPAFQFTPDGEPVPEMREILEIFRDQSDWQIALWFFTPDAWLHEQAPMDVLRRDPRSVVVAAQHFVEPVEG